MHYSAAFWRRQQLPYQPILIKTVGKSQKQHENTTVQLFFSAFLQTLKSEQTDMILIVRNIKINLSYW